MLEMERMGFQVTQALKDLRTEMASMKAQQQAVAAPTEPARRQWPAGADDAQLRLPREGPGVLGAPASSRRSRVGESLSQQRHLWWGNLDEEDDEDEEDDDVIFQPSSRKSGAASSSGRESASASDLQGLLNLEMLRELKRLRRRRSDGSEGSGSEDDANEGLKGFNGVESLRKKFDRHPRKLAAEYEAHCKRILKVTDVRQVWCYRDVSDRIRKRFGRMQGLWRCHAGLQEIVQLLADKKPDHAHAFATAFAKAIHQVALDGGSWDSAALMIPLPDALQEPVFGGSERELAAVHSYRKAMKDLRAKHTRTEETSDSEDETEAGGGGASSAKAARKKAAAAAKKKKAAEAAAKKAAGGAAAGAGGQPT